jgi:hypothetical protein
MNGMPSSRDSRGSGAALSVLGRLLTGIGLAVWLCLAAGTPAMALSEIQGATPAPAEPGQGIPPEATQPAEPDAPVPDTEQAQPDEADEPPPEVSYDLSRLPEPVRRMHDRLLEAAKSGEVEALRPFLRTGSSATQLTLGTMEGDPIAFLKQQAGDEGGQEILAILEEVLSAGYVHMDAGEPEELYVWPYFFAYPIDRLDARQRVELFKIVTAGDYEDMKNFGGYIFYRVGIDPEGRWVFFVAGD